MKKSILNILILLVVVATTFWSTQHFYPRIKEVVRTDTLIKKVPYEAVKIKDPEPPKTVIKYQTKRDTIETVQVKRDTIFITTPDQSFKYSFTYLTNYPQAPKFLGLQKQDDDLRLTYLPVEGQTTSQIWKVGDRNYFLGLNNGNPTIETSKARNKAFKFALSGGWIYSWRYASPYIEFETEISVYGITGTAEVSLNQHPFIQVGYKHRF